MRFSSPDAWIGAVLGGRYRIDEKLASGGMGRVFRAEDLQGKRTVALKVLHPELANIDGADYVERFVREARVAAGLKHPHIVEVLDIATDPNEPMFIASEFVRGESLEEIIEREGALPPARAARIGRQILSALGATHQAGIIHRDLKPANIIISRSTDGLEIAKLLDFGVAKLMQSPTYQRLTATGQLIGTPRYMAPEQATGKEVDARTDVYSAGGVLYATLTGKRPIDGDSLAQLLPAIVQGNVVPIREANPNVPEQLALVIHRAMEVDPSKRWPTADEMATALTAFEAGIDLDGETLANEVSDYGPTQVRAKIPSTRAPDPSAPRYNPNPIPAGGSFAPASVTSGPPAAAGSLAQEPDPTTSRVSPAPTKKKRGRGVLWFLVAFVIGAILASAGGVAVVFFFFPEIHIPGLPVQEPEPVAAETPDPEPTPVATDIDVPDDPEPPSGVEPTPTEPTEPVEVADPEEPEEPIEVAAVDPTEPTEPEQPVEPTEPVPTDPVTTMDAPRIDPQAAVRTRCLRVCAQEARRCTTEHRSEAHALARCYSAELTCERACRR